MKINIELISDLKKLCHNSSHPSVWMASALVHRNKIVSFGMNSMKSNPFQKRYGKNEFAIYKHAEVDAIQNAIKMKFEKFEGSILYVARIKYESTDKKNFISGLAMPCSGCIRCIKEHGIKTVIYTMNDNNFGVIQL